MKPCAAPHRDGLRGMGSKVVLRKGPTMLFRLAVVIAVAFAALAPAAFA